MLEKLNEKFNKEFAGYFGQINSKINRLEKTEDGNFEVPVPVLSNGGATIIPPGADPVTLDAPALVTFEVKKVKPEMVVYRIAFGLEDAAKAAEDEAYFNYLVVPVINEASNRFQKTFGDYNNIRYGEVFCTPFKNEAAFRETDTGVEVRLYGCWASNELVGA